MRLTKLRSRAAAALLAAALASPVAARAGSVTPAMDAEVHAGIDALYEMDFDGAQGHFERLRELAPGHPFADFGLACVGWARYVYGSEMGDDALLKPFDAEVARTVAASKAWLTTHPKDAVALLTLGAAEGIQGRMQLTRRQYVRAYFTARAAMKAVRGALVADPRLSDAYLGLGMYDYYTDVYPRLIRALAKVVLGGSRERGIHELELAARDGRWMSTTAKMILVEIRTHDPFGARDPAEAVRLMREVRALYPRSPMLRSAELTALYQDGLLQEFHAGAADFVRKAEDGVYRPMDLAKGLVLLGTSLWALGRRDEALAAFQRGADLTPRGRWAVWAEIRSGNVLDVLGRRAEALAAYRLAAAEPDRWGYRALAKAGLARAFKAGGEFTADPP